MGIPPRILIFLAVGLVAASQSGNLIRIGDAHPLAIAAWRLILASLVLAPFAVPHRQVLATRPGHERALLVLTGVVLAAHLTTWTAAIQWTTVANATSVLALGPVVTAFGALLFLGEKPRPRFVVAVLLGFSGVVAIGGGDLRLDPSHAAGDAMAVLSMVLFSAYLLLGRRLRGEVPNILYVTVVYAVAGVSAAVLLVMVGQPVFDHGARNWLCFALMAAIPTLIGHTAINSALRYISAGQAALATLVEPPLAGLVAWWVWAEPLTRHGAAGYALIAGAVLLLVTDRPAVATG
ncbi:MAG: DMT family transporter [Pseudomonadota bacterium]